MTNNANIAENNIWNEMKEPKLDMNSLTSTFSAIKAPEKVEDNQQTSNIEAKEVILQVFDMKIANMVLIAKAKLPDVEMIKTGVAKLDSS